MCLYMLYMFHCKMWGSWDSNWVELSVQAVKIMGGSKLIPLAGGGGGADISFYFDLSKFWQKEIVVCIRISLQCLHETQIL